MSEWQPIDTAPKDGKEILAYAPENEYCESRIGVIYFTEYDGWISADYDAVKYEPTHWMPLPPPPVKKHQCKGYNDKFICRSIGDQWIIEFGIDWTAVKYCPFCGEKA